VGQGQLLHASYWHYLHSYYADQGRNGAMSVRMSVCSILPTHTAPILRVCCCGPGGQPMSIYCCTAGAQQQRLTGAGSATLSAYVGSSHRLVTPVITYNMSVQNEHGP